MNPTAELTVKLGDTVLQTHPFEGDLLRIGRSRENDIVLDNLSVSRHHVQIRYHEGQYVLFDMNSSNGTYLNGTRVTRRELLDGDQIAIGKHVLLWHDSSEQSTVLEEEMPAEPAMAEPGERTPPKGTDARANAWVKVESGRLKGREFKIVRFETTLGKAATNDIVLTDDWLLGKKQAIILRKGNDEFELQDLGGLRRVKVNGKPIDKASPLRTGDKLELGGTRLVFFSTAVDHPSIPAQIIMKNGSAAQPAEAGEEGEEAADKRPTSHLVTPPHGVSPQQDSLDLEELLEPAALVAREEAGREGSRKEAATNSAKANAAAANGVATDNGAARQDIARAPKTTPAPPRSNLEPSTAARPVATPAPAVKPAPAPATAAKVSAEPAAAVSGAPEQEIKGGANEKEIQMWESALNNSSPAIRRQAARMLKKLTGRDYDI